VAERSPGLFLLRLVINNKSEERANISYLCADGRHTEGVACSGTLGQGEQYISQNRKAETFVTHREREYER
jgi:hypothetical protein